VVFPRKSRIPATISSNQIFLGLIKSRRPDALLEARDEMDHALENELYTIEQKIRDIFHLRLTVRELAMRVHEVVIIRNLDHPRENRRKEQLVYVTWLREHWGGRGCVSLRNGRSSIIEPPP
jgi:hypothetical protein